MRRQTPASSGPVVQRFAPALATGGAARHGCFGSGAPVDAHLRAPVESATGTDLRDARIHVSDATDDAARSISARAFTVGRDLHFTRDAYRPGTVEGDRLIAHELVHVAQQGAADVAPGAVLPVSDPAEAGEQQAEHVARDARDGGLGAPAAPLRIGPRVARAVATKETKGITLDRTQIAGWQKSDYWLQKIFEVYDTTPVGVDRLSRDPEERDAVGSAIWAEHVKLKHPLKSTVVRLITVPARGSATQSLTYLITFSPASKTGHKANLRYEFLVAGAGAAATTAVAPAAHIPLPGLWTESGFAKGSDGLKGYAVRFPSEVDQLLNWVNTAAPASAFSQIVNTATPKPAHESTFQVGGTNVGGSVSGLAVRLLGHAKPTVDAVPAGYTTHDFFDLKLEGQQNRTKDALGAITGIDTLPKDEQQPVKYTIWQYFGGGTRNAEVDAIVPIPGGTRRILYTLLFAPKTNAVSVRRIGEESKDVTLDPAKRKLDVRRVRGFDPKSDKSALKSWLANRYPGVTPSGASPADMVMSVNKKMETDAGAAPWFLSNYKMSALDPGAAKTKMEKDYSENPKQTVGMKPFASGELRLWEVAIQTLSDAVLDLLRNLGIKLARQVVRIEKVLGKPAKGKPAPVHFEPEKKTAGETFTHGTDSTIVLYDSAWQNDAALFSGDRVGTEVRATPLSAMTALHELGHVTGHSASIQDKFNKRFVDKKAKVHTASVTWYAESGRTKEFFSEAFAIYNQDPEWMRVNIPEMFKWLETLSATGKAPP